MMREIKGGKGIRELGENPPNYERSHYTAGQVKSIIEKQDVYKIPIMLAHGFICDSCRTVITLAIKEFQRKDADKS